MTDEEFDKEFVEKVENQAKVSDTKPVKAKGRIPMPTQG